MPIKEEIRISDNGVSALVKIREEHRSFRDELKSTKKELKETWDKRYKPVIETTSAFKSIQSIQNKATGLKQSLKAKLTIDDKHIQKLRDAQSQMKAFGKMVVSPAVRLKNSAQKSIDSVYSKLLRVGNSVISPVVKLKDNATAKIRKVKTEVSYLSKIIAKPVVVLKDNASAKIKSVVSKAKSLASRSYKATLTALDKTASGISSAKRKITAIAKKTAIPITLAATVATAGVGAAVKSGMQLENQQLSIKHFIGATNKKYTEGQVNAAAESFTNALRENANATPFETGEVIAAGSRAVAITQGNTKEAMNLVKLAEDMAAASGGTKSVSDSMEALADAKLGEMERLKEFGFKVSADEFKKKGFKGVSKDLEGFFGGAAGKLAQSGSGLMSTITGKLKSGVADFGLKIVDQIKPVLTNIIGFIDKAMPVLEKVGSAFGESLGKGIQFVSQMMPSFIAGFKSVMPIFTTLSSCFQQLLPPIIQFGGTIFKTIQGVLVKASPVIMQITQAVSRVVTALQPAFSMAFSILGKITTTIGNIVSMVLPPLGSAISWIADVIVSLSPVVTTIFGGISTYIDGAISGITSFIQGGLDLISSIWSGNWQGIVDAFGTILGGIGEICKAPINGVISILNGAIDAINSVSIETPDWLPFGWGGQKLGFDLGQIPYLAKGGVVKSATTAVIGEAGKEAVMPLERNTGWIGQLAGQLASYMNGLTINMPKMAGIGGMSIPMSDNSTSSPSKKGLGSITVTIAKLADQIIVNDKEDIDDIAEALAKKIIDVARNM